MLLQRCFLSLDKHYCFKNIQLDVKLRISLISLYLSTEIPKLRPNLSIGINCIIFTSCYIKKAYTIEA
jgi:hypothetical protein